MAYWYFQIPNLMLVGLTYLIVAHGILAAIGGERSAVVRPLRMVTDPLLCVAAAVTPRIVPRGGQLIFAVVWLFVARTVLYFGFSLAGIRVG
jgi:hypothetical protein